MKVFVSILCALVVGCGEYVRYEEGGQSPGPSVGGTAPAADAGSKGGDGGVGLEAARQGYASVLEARVRTEGGFALVDYAGLAKSAGDLAALDAYLAAVARATPGAGDLAFWLNAYNARVIRSVVTESGGDSSFTVSVEDFAFFKAERFRAQVAGVSMTLDELEHGVIRGDWGHDSVAASPVQAQLRTFHEQLWAGETVDARIHVALNCAARSCPNLRAEPYLSERLQQQLQDNTGTFLSDASKGAGPNGVSALFDWFAADFVADAGSVEAFITEHRQGGLDGVDATTFLDYDWTLNAQ